jgi:hypothetical protein
MKLNCLLTAITLMAAASLHAQSKTYFISPEGNDNATGMSQEDAWKSLDKVNQMIFQPGDHILFRSGGVWYGQLHPKGSGADGKPIVLSSYGGKARPVINLGRAEGAGIKLENVSWWVVKGMEVTSGAAPELGIGRQGITMVGRGSGQQLGHFVIKDNYIHDIWGQMGGVNASGSSEFTNYNSAGILLQVIGERGAPNPTRFDDVLVENNRIERMDKCGIILRGGKNNIVVRGNYIDNMGGDGIFVNGPYRGLIEYNEVRRTCQRSGHLDLPGSTGWWPHTAAIWIQNTEETIMQYNAVYDTGRNILNGDGNAYDFDFYCKRCIAQYNYSKNNHGFMLVMYNTFENVTRYNISENDRTHLIQVQGNIADRNVFYNNIFYVDYGTSDMDFFRGNDKSVDVNTLGAWFFNNIFYATGQGRFRSVYASGPTENREFDEVTKPDHAPGTMYRNNIYFGPWKNGIPNDSNPIVADPMFVAPGTGGNGLATLDGYQLRPGSPAINAGIYIPFNGGHDFWGFPVEDGATDIGAFEMIGSGVFADKAKNAAADEKYARESSIEWAKWMFPKTVAVSAEGEAVVRLREPLEPQVGGTLVWSDAQGRQKPVTVAIDKAKERNSFTFTLKGDKATWLDSSIRVSLKEGDLTEEVVIPLVEPAPQRRN